VYWLTRRWGTPGLAGSADRSAFDLGAARRRLEASVTSLPLIKVLRYQ
jgi:hypothetical protein